MVRAARRIDPWILTNLHQVQGVAVDGDADPGALRLEIVGRGVERAFTPPPGVAIHQIPPEKSIGSMMLSGELDAALHYVLDNNLVDRSTVELASHPDIKPLFPDPIAEGARYYAKTGIYPINHCMAMKRSIADKHPWAILNLLKAFDAANDIAEKQRLEHVDYHLRNGLLSQDAAAALRTPMVRHGIKANRTVLEAAAQYSHEQGLTDRRVALDEVFAPSTLEAPSKLVG